MFAACAAPVAPAASVAVSHVPPRVQRAVDRGALPADRSLQLVVALRGEDGAAGLTPRDYEEVRRWFAGAGFQVTRTSATRGTLSVRAAASTIDRALGTELRAYEDERGTFRAPSREPVLDLEVSRFVLAIAGLDDAARPPPAPPPLPPRTNGGMDPVDLANLYDTGVVPQPGYGETVAILGSGQPPDPVADVADFVRHYRLFGVITQQYSQVLLGGPSRDPTQVVNDEYGENLLDVDVVLGLAPNACVVQVLTATKDPGELADGLAFIVNQVPQAHAAFGAIALCERDSLPTRLVVEQLLQQAKAEGQQWFFPSGNGGVNACADASQPPVSSPSWPGSSPHALSVGGTTLLVLTELAWSQSGGGPSAFTKPAFQIGVGPTPNDGVRDTPDVAALAGPPGISTLSGGQIFPSESTSASAGMWAAMWTLVDRSQGGVGLANGADKLYALGQQQQAGGPVVFHDITFPDGGVGYDEVTGWGSPDVGALIANWTSVP